MLRMKSSIFQLRICSVCGLLLSAYATYVELRAERDANYVALCDLAERVSCTAVFNTPYGKGFGLLQYITGESSTLNPPNGILGIIFYILLLLTTLRLQFAVVLVQFFMCFASNLMSIYLAYLLYFVLKDLCIVCVSIYVVNFLCWRHSWRILNLVRQSAANEKAALMGQKSD